MPSSLIIFVLSFVAALALPFVEFLNTPYRCIPTITVLGVIALYSAYQVMRFYGSTNDAPANQV
jgi:hypothetical protein